MSPTEDVYAFISIVLRNCFAMAPATTRQAVSRAELRPPPL